MKSFFLVLTLLAVAIAVQQQESLADSISASRLKTMTQIVDELDNLGKFFGEDELTELDDNLSVQEDPKINLADTNFAAAVARLRRNVDSNPDLFSPDYKLRDIGHYLSNPVPVQHYAPQNENDNLDYLRNLRNYAVSMRENQNTSY